MYKVVLILGPCSSGGSLCEASIGENQAIERKLKPREKKIQHTKREGDAGYLSQRRNLLKVYIRVSDPPLTEPFGAAQG